MRSTELSSIAFDVSTQLVHVDMSAVRDRKLLQMAALLAVRYAGNATSNANYLITRARCNAPCALRGHFSLRTHACEPRKFVFAPTTFRFASARPFAPRRGGYADRTASAHGHHSMWPKSGWMLWGVDDPNAHGHGAAVDGDVEFLPAGAFVTLVHVACDVARRCICCGQE